MSALPSSVTAPTSAAVASTLAGRMLCASGLAYAIPTFPPVINPPNSNIPRTAPFYAGVGYLQPPVMIQKGTAACTVGASQDGIIVAFEGTVFNSPLQWINDFLSIVKSGPNVPGKVHSGWYDDVAAIADAVGQEVSALLKASPNAALILTGHSKGAAMAPIAACYLMNSRSLTANSLYLFAPPMPGNTAFVTAFDQSFPDTHCYENYQDIVPLLPPTTAGAVTLGLAFAKDPALSSIERDAMDVALALMALQGYDYVGQDSNISYIEPTTYQMEPMNLLVRVEQAAAVVKVIESGNLQAFASAHVHTCGHGYMSALCPGLCPRQS